VSPLDLTGMVLALALAALVEEAKPARGAEVQDLILLHEDGPMRVRLRITNGDKSVFGRWHDHVERWFKFADMDKDGLIDEAEVARMPSVYQMQQMLQNGQFTPNQQAGIPIALPPLKDIDLDADGKLDRHEFITYYLGTAAGPLLVLPGINPLQGQGVNSSSVSDALFRALDANKDGRLTRDELSRAGELLGRFDVNDDEIVSVQEILGSNPNQFGGQQVQIGRAAAGRAQGFNLGLVPVSREANDLRVTGRLKFAKEMVTKLDADRSGSLSAAEFRIPAAEFAGCDANRDDQLDAIELVKWLVGPPHLAITTRMEQLVEGDPVIVEGDGVRRGATHANGLAFRVGDASVQFDRNTATVGQGYNPAANMKQYMVQVFNAVDKEKAGKLPMEEINKNPQTVYLRNFGKWLDMDVDGFVTVQEIDDFTQLTGGGAWSQLTIGFIDQGRGLFEILDTQPDYNLSIGELRNSAKPLAGYIPVGTEALARTDIPRRYHLQVGYNNNGNGVQMQMQGAVVQRVAQPRPGQPPQTPRRGPGWFQKMDVNLDSYVSPREFLGPMANFRKMDTDGDGLVSDKEADDFAEKAKAAEPRKPEPIREAPVEK